METVRFANYEELTGHGRRALRADALAIAAAGLRAADPADALARALRVRGRPLARARHADRRPRPRGDEGGRRARPTRSARRDEIVTAIDLTGRRLFLLGAGKATLGMAEVLDELLGPRFADAAIVVKRGAGAGAARCATSRCSRPLTRCPTRRASRAACACRRSPPRRAPATSSSPWSRAAARPWRSCPPRASRWPTRSRRTACCWHRAPTSSASTTCASTSRPSRAVALARPAAARS